jgi:hypothetical protein
MGWVGLPPNFGRRANGPSGRCLGVCRSDCAQHRATRTEAHFELWRHERDYTAWKYRMRDKGLKMPTQTKNNRALCFCGTEITSRSMDAHIQQAHSGIGA